MKEQYLEIPNWAVQASQGCWYTAAPSHFARSALRMVTTVGIRWFGIPMGFTDPSLNPQEYVLHVHAFMFWPPSVIAILSQDLDSRSAIQLGLFTLPAFEGHQCRSGSMHSRMSAGFRTCVVLGVRTKSSTSWIFQSFLLFKRSIHARAEQTPTSERQRKLQRPRDSFLAPGKGNKKMSKNESRYVLAPTPYRSEGEHTSLQRKKMQLSRSPNELLKNLQMAINSDLVDTSVFGAAMQRCGQGRWWDALCEVRQRQVNIGIALDKIQGTMYLAALARCVRGEYGFGPIPERQKLIVPLAKQAWTEHRAPNDVQQDNFCFNAALRVCHSAAGTDGIKWGEELWKWAAASGLELNKVSYTNFILLLEAHGKTPRVDAILSDAAKQGWKPDYATLGGLVNAAAERRDWQRGESLWHTLLNEFGVIPTNIQYSARTKLHMLCGRPAFIKHVVNSMLDKNIPMLPQIAEAQFQAALIVYHSTLSQSDRRHLIEADTQGLPITRSASGHQKKTWKELQLVSRSLCSRPCSIRLHDVLIEWKAKQSIMANWANHAAGSGYLLASA